MAFFDTSARYATATAPTAIARLQAALRSLRLRRPARDLRTIAQQETLKLEARRAADGLMREARGPF